jgi:glycosyltransferase involved in cell wall biosynthesis
VSVSVVVPCHNHGHLLGEALDSIAAQGVEGVEILVVDDRSTDDTAAVATAHGALLLPSRAPGAGAARNAGVAASTGDVIAFLDADDLWTPDSLAVRLAALDGRDAAYGAVEEFVDPRFEGAHPEPRTVGPTRVAGTMLLAREAWNAVGDVDETLGAGEFIDWVGRFDAAGLSAASVDAVVLRRRIHATNSTRVAGASVSGSLLDVARMHFRRQG